MLSMLDNNNYPASDRTGPAFKKNYRETRYLDVKVTGFTWYEAYKPPRRKVPRDVSASLVEPPRRVLGAGVGCGDRRLPAVPGARGRGAGGPRRARRGRRQGRPVGADSQPAGAARVGRGLPRGRHHPIAPGGHGAGPGRRQRPVYPLHRGLAGGHAHDAAHHDRGARPQLGLHAGGRRRGRAHDRLDRHGRDPHRRGQLHPDLQRREPHRGRGD
ncbi:hypothetical protein D3C72_387390 [compost metagenome]